MSHNNEDPSKSSLDKIKKQLTASTRCLLQGPLLKRSETLRKWNQRWFTLDPTTGKMEYRLQRGDVSPKGFIHLDAGSSIIISPVNLQGSVKYEGCCIYMVTSTKKEYFLCAETTGCAQAWVSTLQAAQLVLKAHKDAVSSLGGNGSSTVGTVAAVVAAANATAKEAVKVVSSALQSSVIKAGGNDGLMDNLSIMKETLKVKDDELHQMAKDIRAKDQTIRELAERLSETAEAAEAAASAAHIMDKERKAVRIEITKLQKELNEKLRVSSDELKAMEEKLVAVEKARGEALHEAHFWQSELAKAREHAVTMEASLHDALGRAEHSARQVALAVESKTKASLNEEVEPCIKCVPESRLGHIPHDQLLIAQPEVHIPLASSNAGQLPFESIGQLASEKDTSHMNMVAFQQDGIRFQTSSEFQNGGPGNSIDHVNTEDRPVDQS